MAGKGSTKRIKPEPGIKQEHSEDLVLRSRSGRRRSWSSFVFSNLSRLLIWYAILTALFRCPTSANDLTPTSPRICKPYIQVRSFVSPYVSPYYDTYAAPYVEALRPYTETFYFKVYTPAAGAAKETYAKYGEPRVVQTQQFIQEEWDRSIKPRLDDTKSVAQKQYDASIGPYVKQASGKVEPHLRNAQVIASRQYYSTILPTYEKSLPYFWLAYHRVHLVTVEYVYPYSKYGAKITFDFLSRRVWPRLRIVYGENVEPQLVKIKERLANYREGKEIQSVVDDVDSAVKESKASSASSLVSSKSVESKASTADDTSHQSTTTGGKPTPYANEKEEKAQITAELEIWQEKFARASDKGAQELKARVDEITSRQIENQARGVGEALLTELEESVKTSFADLKSAIIRSVRDVPDDATSSDITSAEENTKATIRQAGGHIKGKAQKLRSWRAKFDEETAALVKSATDSTLDVVDNIRDLGLQEIGMRWASMDTVTYQDWSKYHSLKKAVDKWRVKVESVALEHEGITAAKHESEDIESKGMAIAEEAAKELSRLKDVATWKIRADDSSDDFSSKSIPAVAVKLAQQVKATFEDVSSAFIGTSQSLGESVASEASNLASSVMSAASDKFEDQDTPNAASVASNAAKSAASAASSKVADPPLSKAASSASSAASSISKAAAQAASSVSSGAAQGLGSPASKSVESSASVISKSARSSSSSIEKETISPVAKSGSSAYSKVSDAVASSISSASKSAASFSSSVSEKGVSSASSVSKSAASAASVADQKVMSPASKIASSASSAAPSVDAVERVQAASAERAAKFADSASAASASMSSAASSASDSFIPKAASKISSISSGVSSVASSGTKVASVKAKAASASASSQSSEMSTSLSSVVSSIQSKRFEEASPSGAPSKRPSAGFAMAQPAPGQKAESAIGDDDDDDSDSDDEDTPPEPTNEAELDEALSIAMDRAKSQAASLTDDAFSKASHHVLPPGETDLAQHTANLINAALSMSKEMMKAASGASSEWKQEFLSSMESTKSSLASEASESSRRAAARPTDHPEL